ncbi:MAG: ECF transporter S component [Clostridiales bacterium]|nr:ECF transporter S component [Clostridiales bacterium]
MHYTKEEEKTPFWKRLLFSRTLAGKNQSRKIAYIAVMTALCIATNFFEFKFLDNQFSLTITVALLTGVIIGAVFGFTACVLGDFLGFLANPAYMYMPWVGLSTGVFALLSGMIFNGFPCEKKWAVWLKLFGVCIVTFLVCTVGINSTGFYFYNRAMGFSTAVLDYIASRFGGDVSFWGYIVYRLIFKGQIWNSVFNYALFIAILPSVARIKALKLKIS